MANSSKSKEKPEPSSLVKNLIDFKKTNDDARKLDLAMEIIATISMYAISPTTSNAEDFAEALSVLVSTTAFLIQSQAVPELAAMDQYRRLFRAMRKANKKLGPRATAKEVFAEVSVT